MTNYSFKINGAKFDVICECWQTSYSWGHKVTVLKDGTEVTAAKIRYYNRTWESFTYESCINAAINAAKNKVINFITADFKRVNGYKVLTAGRRAELAKVINKDTEIKQYTKLFKNICAARHPWF